MASLFEHLFVGLGVLLPVVALFIIRFADFPLSETDLPDVL